MPTVEFSAEFAQTIEPVERLVVEVDGRTVLECIRNAEEQLGADGFVEQIFDGPGSRHGLSEDVGVYVNDARVDDADASVPEDGHVCIAPLKGSSRPLENAGTP